MDGKSPSPLGEGEPRIEVENDDKEGERELPNRKSAGVCAEIDEEGEIYEETASQRINAKELKYILGLIEAEGSFSCFWETKGEKRYLRVELAIGLEEADWKLVAWVKKKIGQGQVKRVKFSKTAMAVRKDNAEVKYLARYILRSKLEVGKVVNGWFKEYPPITKNKRRYIE